MVWHENKCIDIASRTVEVEQAILDFPAHVRPPQLAGAHTGIQPFLHTAAEPLFIFALLCCQPQLRMPSQPDRTLFSPLAEQRLRQ